MNIKDLKASISLREYIEANSNVDLTHCTTTNNYILYRNCPFCNHKDHFAIYTDSERFCSFNNCFVSGNGKNTGDIIDFIMHQDNIDSDEAVDKLKEYIGAESLNSTKSKPLGVKKMNDKNNALNVEYSNKKYDFTNECLNNIAIGTDGAKYYYDRGLNNDIIQSYMLGYTDSFNAFLSKYPELQKLKFYSADIFNYVIPNVSVSYNDDGSISMSIDHVIFRANDNKLKELNKNNKEQGKKLLQKYMKVMGDVIFNSRYICESALPDKFNLIKYEDTTTLFITEGQFDALTIEQNKYHAISLNSVKNINTFLELVSKNINTVKNYKFKIIFDNDDSGRNASNTLFTELTKLNLNVENITFSPNYHDVNEFYLKSKSDFIELLNSKTDLNNSKGYIDAELDYLDEYLEQIVTAEKDTCIPTGFTKFDTALGGGLFPGLYVMGGTPGAGKTAIANAIADSVATNGNLACVFSLELSKNEVINRSISAISFAKIWDGKFNLQEYEQKALTMNDMKRHHKINTNPIKLATLKYCFDKYKKNIAPNKIVVKQDIVGTTVGFIRNKINDIVLKENRKPVVIVDYLQRLKSDKNDNISAISENIAMLKQLSIDLEIPIIVITSYNRTGYLASANMSQGKGSGDIEYTADCIIAAQLKGCGDDGFNQEAYDDMMSRDIRELELVFLKNRNWKVGIKTELSYIPAFNVVEEN